MARLISSESLKKLELNALLEITTAISQNVSKADLFKIFKFTLKGNHLIQKVALFIKTDDQEWNCVSHFGVNLDFPNITKEILNSIPKTVHEPRGLYNGLFEDFDVVLPVYHKERVLAFVFVDGDEAFGEELRNERFDFIQTLSNIILYALENKNLISKQLEQQALKKELEIASKVQSQLVPSKFPKIKNTQFYSTYIPHSKIGGDYYDLVICDKNSFYVCVADVSGKGVPAAIFMSNFQASLRVLLELNYSLEETVRKLNKHIVKNTGGDFFITFFLAKIDFKSSEIQYINAGHNHPIFLDKKTKDVKYLTDGSTFLGAFDDLPSVRTGTLNFDDSLLVLYTDGLTETYNEKNEEFSIEKVEEIVVANLDQSLERVHAELIKSLDTHRNKINYIDDITIFSISLNSNINSV